MSPISRLMLTAAFCAAASSALAQAAKPAPAPDRFGAYDAFGHDARIAPPLFFREEWKRTPGPVEHPMTQANVASPNLEIKLYGPSGRDIQFNGGPGVEPPNPAHLWTGVCQQVCGAALRDKNNYVDLSGLAKIHWQVRISGLHRIHPMLKLADGTWLLGEHEDGTEYDLHPTEFTLSESRWIKLDIDRLVTVGRWVDKPDLSKVDEIGFTDLMPASGHGDGGYMDMGWVEVYGRPVPRRGN